MTSYNILILYLITFSILQVIVLTSQSNFYTTFVRTNSILRKYAVSSISSCYFECWDFEFKFCAVGFLSSEINSKKRNNATCHMIKCNQLGDGVGDMELEVLETPKLFNEEPVKLPKNGVASQKNIFNENQDGFYARNAADGYYEQDRVLNCSHTKSGVDNFWEYSLPYNYAIESIEIYGRSHINHIWKLSNADILVKTESGFSYCGNTGDMNNTSIRRIYCEKTLKGNGIRVQSLTSKAISICEVDMYGKKLY